MAAFQNVKLSEHRRSGLFQVRFQSRVGLLWALNFWNRASAAAVVTSRFFLAARSVSFFPGHVGRYTSL
jgi:hypothetical protein